MEFGYHQHGCQYEKERFKGRHDARSWVTLRGRNIGASSRLDNASSYRSLSAALLCLLLITGCNSQGPARLSRGMPVARAAREPKRRVTVEKSIVRGLVCWIELKAVRNLETRAGRWMDGWKRERDRRSRQFLKYSTLAIRTAKGSVTRLVSK